MQRENPTAFGRSPPSYQRLYFKARAFRLDRPIERFAGDVIGVLQASHLKVDVIVAGSPTAAVFLKEATSTVPIVVTYHTDPVGAGLVESLAQPGGNITGLSVLAPELGGKRIEVLKEIVPKLSRVVILGSSTLPGNAEILRHTEQAAGAFGVKAQFFDILTPWILRRDSDEWPSFVLTRSWRREAGFLMLSAIK